MSSSALYETFARAPLAFEQGEGVWLIEPSGERYLDLAGGIAVNSLGHSHPHLVAALTEQAGKLWHVSNLYEIPGSAGSPSGLSRTPSPTRSSSPIPAPRRWNARSRPRAAISSSTAIPSATARSPSKAPSTAARWRRSPPAASRNISRVSARRSTASTRFRSTTSRPPPRRSRPETAAILVEPVQGEGGIRSFPTQSLKRLRELCDKHGLLLIFDEVQCGIGRTGKLFAYEWSGVEPDLMAIAKGIGGGFPMGACLSTDAAAIGMTAGVHGTTFGGNPLAMAVGNAVLDVVLDDGFLDEVGHKGLLMKQGLAAIADEFPEIVEDIRGIGLMLGLKCVAPNARVSGALRDQKVLAVPAGDNVVRLLPPLVISEDEIRIGLERIRNGVRSLARATAAAAV